MEKIETGIYKHFKGKQSLVIAVAKHSDREEELVVYKGLSDGNFYCRPLSSFLETVEYNGEKVKRFSLVKAIDFSKSFDLNNFWDSYYINFVQK